MLYQAHLLVLLTILGGCVFHSKKEVDRAMPQAPESEQKVRVWLQEYKRKPLRGIEDVNFTTMIKFLEQRDPNSEWKVSTSLISGTLCRELVEHVGFFPNNEAAKIDEIIGSLRFKLKTSIINQDISCQFSLKIEWLKNDSWQQALSVHKIMFLQNKQD